MKVINFFGSPGSAKSTTAAGLFTLMKWQQFNVELVTEVAKDFVWENRHQCLMDQIYIFGCQNHRLERLRNKVEWAIIDSPLILSIVYEPKGYYKNFQSLVMEVFNNYNNTNIFMNRVKPYSEIGRTQTEAEADEVGRYMKNKLKELMVEYYEVDGDEKAPTNIYELLKEKYALGDTK